jgi:hypothetical protein
LIEDFERHMEHGFPDRSQPGTPRIAHFVFTHYRGYEGEAPAFAIWPDHTLEFFMAMGDIAHHWRLWFDLLEELHHGRLPVEVVLQRKTQDQPSLYLFIGLEIVITVWAIRAAGAGHVQLKIISELPAMGPESTQTVMDALIDRQQFVGEFALSFKQFLQTDYKAYLQGGETQFDLRLLPLDSLLH